MSIEDHLQELSQQLNRLPKANEPPPTTLKILGRNHQEQDWQRLLFYFLSPDQGHGLEHALLEHILSALSERDDFDYTYSRFDLTDVQVATEVVMSNDTCPDAVLWVPGEWFICWELKLWASEGHSQTKCYTEAASFTSIGLSKDDIPAANHYYAYLAPESASRPKSTEFTQISWEWIASKLQKFLAEGHGSYPARTTAQLDEFISTIQRELTMTEHQKNQQEKAKLYFDYYDKIKEVQDAFDNEWDDFEATWGQRLAQSLDVVEIIENPDISENWVLVEVENADEEPERWIFRQGNPWAGIAKEQWRRRTDDLVPIYSKRDDDAYAHITLFHRLEKNRDLAIEDGVLELTLWHGTSSDESLQRMVTEKINNSFSGSDHELPAAVSLSSGTGRILTARYDIPSDEYDDFFDAYTAALRDAFVDLVIDHHDLISIIDDAFEESLKSHT